MAYAAAIIAGVTAIVGIVGSVYSANKEEEAAKEQNKALASAGEEARAIGEQERADRLKSDKENRALTKRSLRESERQGAFVRGQALRSEQRQNVEALAATVNDAIAGDSVFKSMIRKGYR